MLSRFGFVIGLGLSLAVHAVLRGWWPGASWGEGEEAARASAMRELVEVMRLPRSVEEPASEPEPEPIASETEADSSHASTLAAVTRDEFEPTAGSEPATEPVPPLDPLHRA